MAGAQESGVGEPGRAELGLGAWFDFRNPARWQRPPAELYAEHLELAALAEQLGYDAVWLSEHHFTGDGYTSSPLTVAAAVAARTSRIAIGTDLLILPLADPLRVAEDALTVDALSGGRLRLGVGLGYRREEFAGFGVSPTQRRSRLEEGIAILRGAFAGEPVAADGRHWHFAALEVTPGPCRAGGPELWVGGYARPAVERAARLGDGYLCPAPHRIKTYVEARAALGLPAGRVAVSQSLIVVEDPEEALGRLGEGIAYQVEAYRRYGAFGDPEHVAPVVGVADAIERGLYRVLGTEEAAQEIASIARLGPVVDFHCWSRVPGEDAASAALRMEHLATRVLPRVRALLSGSADSL